MKTVGEILKQTRLEKGIKKREVAKKTKINLTYLEALEANQLSKLPEAAFVKGFIRSYANAIGLNPDQVLAVFRRDYDQNLKGQVIPRELIPTTPEKKNIWNPKTTTLVGVIVLVIILAAYFIYQFNLLTAAPFLEVSYPSEQDEVTTTFTVIGKTDSQATLTINNQQVLINDQGEFSQSLDLPFGTRTLIIKATNRSGKSRTLQRTINVVVE